MQVSIESICDIRFEPCHRFPSQYTTLPQASQGITSHCTISLQTIFRRPFTTLINNRQTTIFFGHFWPGACKLFDVANSMTQRFLPIFHNVFQTVKSSDRNGLHATTDITIPWVIGHLKNLCTPAEIKSREPVTGTPIVLECSFGKRNVVDIATRGINDHGVNLLTVLVTVRSVNNKDA